MVGMKVCHEGDAKVRRLELLDARSMTRLSAADHTRTEVHQIGRVVHDDRRRGARIDRDRRPDSRCQAERLEPAGRMPSGAGARRQGVSRAFRRRRTHPAVATERRRFASSHPTACFKRPDSTPVPVSGNQERSGVGQDLAEERAVAAGLVLTVAADAEARRRGQRRQDRDQPLGGRLAHLRAVLLREHRPALVGPCLRERPLDERRARRESGAQTSK